MNRLDLIALIWWLVGLIVVWTRAIKYWGLWIVNPFTWIVLLGYAWVWPFSFFDGSNK